MVKMPSRGILPWCGGGRPGCPRPCQDLGEGSRHGGPLCFLYHIAPRGGPPT